MCSLRRQNANNDENIVYNRHFGTSNDNINTPDINHSAYHHGKLNTSNSTGSLTNSTNNISSISSTFHKHKHPHVEVENAGEIRGHLDTKTDALRDKSS